jgi:hypothetical protein
MEADRVMVSLIPVFLVAQLMAAARPFQAGRRYHLMRRIGLTAMILGAAGLVVCSAIWMVELESYGRSHCSFEWLQTGARLLRWGAVVFLACATAGGALEFARQCRLRDDVLVGEHDQ